MAVKVNLPEFATDKYYQPSQDLSFGMGSDILKGKLPEWMEGLGETGSKQFKDMLAMVNRDTATAVNENLVRRNIKGGVGLSSIAKATADAGTKLSWADYTKASGEKQDLLKTGLTTTAGVTSAGLTHSGQKNQYEMGGAQLRLSADKFNAEQQRKDDEAAQAKKNSKNALWGKIISAGIGAAGTILSGGLSNMFGSAKGVTPSGGGALPSDLSTSKVWNQGDSGFQSQWNKGWNDPSAITV